MPLPTDFNEWEFLQDTIRLWHNKNVTAWFKNQPDDDISTPKRGLKHACRMKDSDTSIMTLMRMYLFDITAGHAQSLQAPIYGIPVDVYQSQTEFKPQVHIHFRERYPYINNRIRASEGVISFVLMNESSSTYTRTKAEALALDIKREFGNPIFVWNKGKYYYYYRDKERGYDLRLLVLNKTEGRRIAQAVLAIQGHPFSDDNEDYVDNSRSYPNNPGTQIVYGQSHPKPTRRPTVDVRFRYAQLLLHGRTKTVNLVATPEAALKQVIQRLSQG